MSPETLRAQIESEIGKDWDRTNLHGVDLRACLLQRPVIKTYENSFFDPKRAVADHNTTTVEMWQVLKEAPRPNRDIPSSTIIRRGASDWRQGASSLACTAVFSTR